MIAISKETVINFSDDLDKAKYPVGYGYDRRSVKKPLSIIVHSTNGRFNSEFINEAIYLAASPIVGAHYLVGKAGDVQQILHPSLRAWHAGSVNDQRFNNNNSIGIECHYTPGEGIWTDSMKRALTDLCRYLINLYDIQLIERHRTVASPKGRKIDPSGFLDVDFITWRTELFLPKPKVYTYKVIKDAVNIRSSARVSNNIVGSLKKNDIIASSETKHDELGQFINGMNTWIHFEKGYVHANGLKLI